MSIDFDLCFGEKRMNFVLPSPKCTLSLLTTNQSAKVEKSLLNVFVLLLYSYVGKPDKYHRHIIKVHYLQLVACRWYKLKRAVDQNWILWYTTCYWCFIRICIFHTDNKLPIWEIWCVPLDCLISKTQKKHF